MRITVSAKASTLTRSKTNNPVVNRLMTATGTIRVISENGEGETLLSTSRTASASYTTNGQILADQQALRAAQEQAMHALAETIRQMLLAELTQ